MNKCPAIGDRVSHPGRRNCGPYTGTVHAIYPTYEWDELREREIGVLPEKAWHVGVTVDAVPDPWPYPGTNKIAPCVAELKRLTRAAKSNSPCLMDGDIGQGECQGPSATRVPEPSSKADDWVQFPDRGANRLSTKPSQSSVPYCARCGVSHPADLGHPAGSPPAHNEGQSNG